MSIYLHKYGNVLKNQVGIYIYFTMYIWHKIGIVPMTFSWGEFLFIHLIKIL